MKKSMLIFVLAALLLPLAAFGQPVLNLEYSNKVLEHAFDEAFFSKDGDYIYGVENGGYLIYKYETATGEYHSTLEFQTSNYHFGDIDMSYDGLRLAALTASPYNEGPDFQSRLLIWNTETDKVIHDVVFPPDSGYYSTWATPIALSPDGGIAIFNINHHDKPLYKPVNSTYIYDVNEAKVIKILEGLRSAAIKFTHDGRYFATVDFYWGKERISLWDAQSFERIGTIYEIPAEGSSIVRDFEFSLDDKYVWLIHDYGGIGKVINVETLELVYKSKEGERCTSIELLPDNQS
ncbi:MAG: WD40 repeat domain-containing protein, partial [Candidatus Kapaibacterium sp.]